MVALKTTSTESRLDLSLPHSNKYALALHVLVQGSLRGGLGRRVKGLYHLCWLQQAGRGRGARESLVTPGSTGWRKGILL